MATVSARTEFLEHISCDPKAVLQVPTVLLQDDTFVRNAISSNALCVLHVPEWRGDVDRLLFAVRVAPFIYMHLRPPFSNNPKIVHQAVQLNGLNLGSVPSRFRDDFDLVELAVVNNGDSLRYASDRLRADDHIIRKAVASAAESIESALGPSDQRVMQAINAGHVAAFRHGSTMLREQRDVSMQVVGVDETLCQYVHHHTWPKKSADFEVIEKLRKRLKSKRAREN